MGHCLCRCRCGFEDNLSLHGGNNEIDLVTDKSLQAAEVLVEILKHYVETHWIFRPRPYTSWSIDEKVCEALRKGKKNVLRRLVTRERAEDGVSGLQLFLTKLNEPLIPPFIQALAMDENHGVSPDIVALDMLGLMKQNLSSRHLRLLTIVLDLLHSAVRHTHTDELKGSAVPISMLPIFFHLQALHIPRWRRLVSVLMEMIRVAPQELDIPQPPRNMQIATRN